MQLLNTPIISLPTLSALEDRHGLVSIDCGDEQVGGCRIVIPMLTHPFWYRHRSRFFSPPSHAAATTAAFLGRAEPISVLQMIVFYATWLLLLGIMMYPYALIIFLAWRQVLIAKEVNNVAWLPSDVFATWMLFVATLATIALTSSRVYKMLW